jgi:hypothetical protein
VGALCCKFGPNPHGRTRDDDDFVAKLKHR